jgi:hypothetical protein
VTRFNADDFADGFSETFGRVVGWGLGLVVVSFGAVMAVGVGIAGWQFLVHQLQK